MQPVDSRNPVGLRFGRGRISELEALISRPALIVTTRGTIERIGIDRVATDLDGVHLFPEVTPNPGPMIIDRGAALAESLGVRTIVGLGGGSALDAAKCIALMVGNDPSAYALDRRLSADEALARQVELIAVPTTAGSGSEVTCWASVWEPNGRKWSLEHASAYADIAIVDPQLTDTMGARLTAAAGLDALSHAVESIWSTGASPTSDDLATAALRLVRTALPAAIDAPTPRDRDAMAMAALLAGLALSSARSATAHALSYSLTGRFGVEHGLATGLMCRALLKSYAASCGDRVALIADALSAASVSEVEGFIDEIFRLAGLEPSLRFFGVPRDSFGEIAFEATRTDRIVNSRIPTTVGDLRSALELVE